MRTRLAKLGIALACVALAGGGAVARELEITSAAMENDGVLTEFRGNVHITGENLDLRADFISFDTTTNLYGIRGTPAIVELGSATITTSITAPAVDYDAAQRQVRISGGGHITHGKLEVQAMSITYDETAASIAANQDVRISEDNYAATGTQAQVRNLAGNTALVIKGVPATFNTRHGEADLQARANRIEYDRATSIVRLLGNASARYGNEHLSGESLTYNLRLGTFSAAPSTNGRVTAIISLP